METKEILESIQKEWHELKTVLETRDKELGETKQIIEKLNNRIDELEAKLNKVPVATPQNEEKDELEKKAFLEWARKGTVPPEMKLLTTTDPTTGGIFAPVEFSRKIIEKIIEISPFREVAFVRSTSASLVQAPVDNTEVAFSWIGEAKVAPEISGVSLGLERIDIHQMAGVVRVTIQDLEDIDFDIENYLIKKASTGIAKQENQAFLLGDGVRKPKGLLTDTRAKVIKSGHASTIPSPDVLFKVLYEGIIEAYAKNGVWLLNRKTLGVLRTFKDNEGRYIWSVDGLLKGAPTTLLGMPYVIMPDMPDIGAGSIPIVFGDFSEAYWIVDRKDITVMRDQYTESAAGIVRFIFTRRVGGRVVNPDAYCKLQISA